MIKINNRLKRGLSVIVPIYNEEKILEKNMQILDKFLSDLKIDYEIILSENGSKDKSKIICEDICRKNKRFKYILNNVPSFGEAIRRGSAIANYDKMLEFPADLWGLDYIKEALDKIDQFDVVYGSRYLKKSKQKRSLIRIIISVLHTKLVNLIFNTRFTDIDGMKMYKTGIGKRILAKTVSKSAFIEVEIGVIIKNSKIKFIEVPISHIEPKTRHLKYVIKIILQGMYYIIKNYGRLRKIVVS